MHTEQFGQQAAIHSGVLQCVCSVFAVCCRVSCVAVCCNVSNCIAVHELPTYSITSDACRAVWVESIKVYRAVCCSVVQCGAVFCSVFAVCCNVSQYVAVYGLPTYNITSDTYRAG